MVSPTVKYLGWQLSDITYRYPTPSKSEWSSAFCAPFALAPKAPPTGCDYPNPRSILIRNDLPPDPLPPPPPLLTYTPNLKLFGGIIEQQPEDVLFRADNGICDNLIKTYYRFEEEPQPEELRPLDVLHDSLNLLIEAWQYGLVYELASDHLKAIRQEMVVQSIRNEVTVEVYETHARLAMFAGDYVQFTICQAKLIELYNELPHCTQHVDEFIAYRILYNMFIVNPTDTQVVYASLTETQQRGLIIRHAILTQAAWARGHRKNFFTMYKHSPHYGYNVFMIDWFISRERKLYFRHLLRRRSFISVSDIANALVFSNREKTFEFLSEYPIHYRDQICYMIDCNVTLYIMRANVVVILGPPLAYHQTGRGQMSCHNKKYPN